MKYERILPVKGPGVGAKAEFRHAQGIASSGTGLNALERNTHSEKEGSP